MSARSFRVEIVAAKDYYRHPWAVGWVTLVDGEPHHSTTLREAKAFAAGFEEDGK